MMELAKRFALAGFFVAVFLYAVSAFIVWGWPAISEWRAGERFFLLVAWAVLTALAAG